MKRSSFISLLFFQFCFLPFLKSQLVITPNVGSTGIINTVSGSGIVVSNVTINCGNNSYGSFSNGTNAGLGIGTGLVLTTGVTSALNAPGTNANDDFDTDLGTSSNDPQLVSVIGNNVDIFDPCIIEFDVVPQCGVISITFVFGSDEYTNWVSQGFNDGFGFFVSGPNPAGGNYTNSNIAKLPTGTLVSIDNVNTTTNSTYFTNNNTGTFINHLDGFTKVLTPTLNVVPCQTYHFKLAIADAGDGAVDSAVLIDIIQCSNPLTLTTNSTPDQCNNGIGTATVSTSGGNSPFNFDWQPTGGNQATANNLQSGTYTVTVSDNLTCTQDQTATVIVGNNGIPATMNPIPNITVCNAQIVNLTNFTSSQTSITYSWTNSNPTIGLAANGTGAQPTFTATNTGNTPLISTITVTPNNGSNCPPITQTYTITVNPTPNINPISNITVCAGEMINVPNFTGNVNNTVFNWTNSNTSIGLTSNGTNNILPFASINNSNTQITSNLQITPTLNSCSGTPINVILNVNPTPALTPIADVTICEGNQVPGSNFISSIPGSTINWTNSNATIGLTSNGTGNYNSFNGLTSNGDINNSTISVYPTLNNCNGTTLSYTISVSPTPTMDTPLNITNCANQLITVPNFSSNPSSQVLFTWTNDNTSSGLSANGTSESISFTGINTSTNSILSNISVTPSIGQCIGSPVSFTIEVLPTPSMIQPNSIIVCPDEQITPDIFQSTPIGSTFNWENTNTSIGLNANGTGDILPFNGINNTSINQISNISITPTLNGCNGQEIEFNITVKPLPVLNPIQNIEVCENETINQIQFISNPMEAIYDWTNSNTTIGLSANGTGNISTFTGINNSNSPNISSIIVTPTLDNCVGIPLTFSITVNPNPEINISNNGPLCENETLELYSDFIEDATYSWTGPNFNSQEQNPIINNVTIANAGDYSLTVTLNGCTNRFDDIITIYPIVLYEIIGIEPVCENDSPITLNSTGGIGLWSGNGIIDENNGIFDPSLANIGINNITFESTGQCPTQTTTQIIINPIPNASFTPNITSGCIPLEVKFNNNSQPNGDNSFWNFGDNITSSSNDQIVTHIFNEIGCFDISLTTESNGCQDDTIQSSLICVFPNAIADFIPIENEESLTISNSLVHFLNQSINSSIYNWNFGDGTSSNLDNPQHLFQGIPQTYHITLIANNEYNCPDTTHQIITIKDELIYYVPNTFTPDNDNFNQVFKPIFTSGFQHNSYHLLIFNRWGEILFESRNSEVGWNGTYGGNLVQDDIYVWKIEFKEKDSDKKYSQVGHVNVLR